MNLVINAAEAIGDSAGNGPDHDRDAARRRGLHCARCWRRRRSRPGDYVIAAGARYGQRHDAGDHRQDLRPVLHHQIHRPRSGPRGGARESCADTAARSRSTARRAGDHVQGAVPGQRASRARAHAAGGDASAARGGETVLVVDDEQIVRRSAQGDAGALRLRRGAGGRTARKPWNSTGCSATRSTWCCWI